MVDHRAGALERDGRESWAARAISHQLVERIAWDVVDGLDLVIVFPCDALCAACATLDPAGEGA